MRAPAWSAPSRVLVERSRDNGQTWQTIEISSRSKVAHMVRYEDVWDDLGGNLYRAK